MKTTTPTRLAFAPLVMLAVGCTAGAPRDPLLDDLVGAERLELLALHPYPHERIEPLAPAADFHGYEVLGRADASDVAERDTLLALVRRGIDASDGRVAACFNPRHGLSFTKDGHVTDLVICFECLSLNVYVDGARADSYLTADRCAADVTALFTAHGLAIHSGG